MSAYGPQRQDAPFEHMYWITGVALGVMLHAACSAVWLGSSTHAVVALAACLMSRVFLMVGRRMRRRQVRQLLNDESQPPREL